MAACAHKPVRNTPATMTMIQDGIDVSVPYRRQIAWPPEHAVPYPYRGRTSGSRWWPLLPGQADVFPASAQEGSTCVGGCRPVNSKIRREHDVRTQHSISTRRSSIPVLCLSEDNIQRLQESGILIPRITLSSHTSNTYTSHTYQERDSIRHTVLGKSRCGCRADAAA